jgi:triacylglycerol lipase
MQAALAIALAVLCLQALGGAAWWWWSRNLAPSVPARDRALSGGETPLGDEDGGGVPAATRPVVVLVHGILGFGTLGIGRTRVHYFRRVARRLTGRGLDVAIVRLPPLGGTPARARALIDQLAQLPHRDIVIVAHSLGGLDARWALARIGADRVRAVITIGTPHRGTPIADALARGPAARLRGALTRLGIGSDGVDWLTTERLTAFNREIADVPGVIYASVVTATAERRRIHPLLWVTHAFLAGHGPSDGLVPASSQVWGHVVATAEVDHWAQIGWSGGHDAAALVERALEAIRALPGAEAPRQLPAPARALAS